MAFPLVGGLFATIAVFIGNILAPITNRVMAHIGLSVATFTGITVISNYLLNQIKDQFALLPTQPFEMLMLMNFDIYFSLMFSAIAIRYAIRPKQFGLF